MKCTIILLLAACLQVSASGYSQTISVKLRDVSFEKALKEVAKKSGYQVFYQQPQIKQAKAVSLVLENTDVKQVLDELFKAQPLKYEITNKTIVVSPKEVKSLAVNEGESAREGSIETPPTKDIRGKVTDAEGNPLAGASIKVKGTTLGTLANADGVFVLQGVDEQSTIEVSFVGYESLTLSVGSRSLFIVSLKAKQETLQEVVVNKGYYTEKQKYSVSNVGRVTAKEIERQPVSNPLLALQGRVPGLQIVQSNGVTGGGVTVRIQGQNSIFNGNDPLYIVDGVPYPSQSLNTVDNQNLLGNGSVASPGGSPLAFINPLDIESIDILKDADATAIYGSRAANGAVLITLKKGRAGKPRVSVNAFQGWGKASNNVSVLNNVQYIEMRREALKNSNTTPTNSNAYDIRNVFGWDTTRNTDWVKTLVGNTAKFTNVNASISGGNNELQYLIGGTYNNESNVFIGDFSNQRGGIHFNLGSSGERRLSFNLSGTFNQSENNLPAIDLFYTALALSPTAPTLYNPDGTLNWAIGSSGFSTWFNPVVNQLNKYENKTTNMIGKFQIGYRILPGLEFKTDFGYNKLETNTFNGTTLATFEPAALANAQREARYGKSQITTTLIEPQLNYLKKTGVGRLEMLLGTTFQKTLGSGYIINGKGYNSDVVLKDMGSAASLTSQSSIASTYNYNALFANIKYSHLDRYLLSISGRRDGSSRFGGNNRINDFWSVGAGWIFSEEKFIKSNQRFLSFGKIRGNYGVTGNDQIGDYMFMSLYEPLNFGMGIPYQGVVGLASSNLSNPDLKWERNKKLNIGLDLGFFNDQLQFSTTYVLNRSSNQLMNYPLPIMVGFGTVTQNLDATIQNKSWEFQITYNNRPSAKLKFTSTANITLPKNKLVRFDDLNTSTYASNLIIGQPVDVQRIYRFRGVNPTTGLYQFEKADGTVSSSLTPDDKIDFRSFFPKFYGGWTNNISYGGFDLSIHIQFSSQQATNYKFGTLNTFPGRVGINQLTTVLDRWQKPGDDKGVQLYGTRGQTTSSYLASSDARYVNSYYARVKNIMLSYSLNAETIKKMNIAGLKVYMQAQNLFTITNFTGVDPETASSRTPPIKMVTIGIQATF